MEGPSRQLDLSRGPRRSQSLVPGLKYQSDHFKVFNSATKGGAIVKVGQSAFADLVDITVNAGAPE